MRLSKYIFFFFAISGFAACQNSDVTPKVDVSKNVADLTLRATSDIKTPSSIKAATFVPNSVASWLGHIILLDDKGILHRATTDSTYTDVVALGKYKDVIGLKREKKSGVFLALTPQGQIKAFVQTDDIGNFGPMAVSQGSYNFKRFCSATEPTNARLWAETENGPRVFSLEIFEDSSLNIHEVDLEVDEANLCEANSALKLNQNYTLKPNTQSAYLTLSNGQKDLAADITNGLSISGIDTAGFVTVTNANMGSVFNEGVILVADETEGRLVLISLAYALKELETY